MWLELTVLALSLLGMVLGSGLGAYFWGVSLWKGPAISFSASVGQAALSEFAIPAQLSEWMFLLNWVIYVVIAGLVAWALKVGPRACAVIVIGGLLGSILFAFAGGFLMLSLMPTEMAPTDGMPLDVPPLDGAPPHTVPPDGAIPGNPPAEPAPPSSPGSRPETTPQRSAP